MMQGSYASPRGYYVHIAGKLSKFPRYYVHIAGKLSKSPTYSVQIAGKLNKSPRYYVHVAGKLSNYLTTTISTLNWSLFLCWFFVFVSLLFEVFWSCFCARNTGRVFHVCVIFLLLLFCFVFVCFVLFCFVFCFFVFCFGLFVSWFCLRRRGNSISG